MKSLALDASPYYDNGGHSCCVVLVFASNHELLPQLHKLLEKLFCCSYESTDLLENLLTEIRNENPNGAPSLKGVFLVIFFKSLQIAIC